MGDRTEAGCQRGRGRDRRHTTRGPAGSPDKKLAALRGNRLYPESTDRKLDGAGCRAGGEFGGCAGCGGVRRAAPGAGRSEEPSLSDRSGAAEGAGARVREACAGMLARASDPGPALWAGRQTGSGSARSRASAAAHWPVQGQRFGRCRVQRRAEWVSRPARAKKRRLSVLVVTIPSPSPSRAVQRARLCAITCTASHAAFAAKRPEGRWLSPTPYLRSRIAFSTSACRRWSASSSSSAPARSLMKAW